MAVEIERKFLLVNDSWRDEVEEQHAIRQGYLAPLAKASVRVRVEDDRANINIKSATIGVTRMEYEYEIPLSEGIEMLDNLCTGPQINKTRYLVRHGNHTWEIDEFYDDNDGLIVAEVELESVDQRYEKPSWIGDEVSDDPRYYNVNLIKHPFKEWER